MRRRQQERESWFCLMQYSQRRETDEGVRWEESNVYLGHFNFEISVSHLSQKYQTSH